VVCVSWWALEKVEEIGSEKMAGIAGIASSGKQTDVNRTLDKMAHRGPAGLQVVEVEGNTLGMAWTQPQANSAALLGQGTVRDDIGGGNLAQAQVVDGQLTLQRGPLGVAPLYYGYTEDGHLCFASEVKAMLAVTCDVHELPPGYRYAKRLNKYFQLRKRPALADSPTIVAQELRRRLSTSVLRRINDNVMGAWLSGGLDSSAMAALARPHVKTLYTFAAGVAGAPDLKHARVVANFIKSKHHEIIVSFEDMLSALPHVIYHLESFDALLVRSSITNYLVARLAADHVPTVFSGEGGDELFAGYDYLKSLDPARLPDELIDITCRLHNTALQRVDRCASAHGLVAHVGFLDPDVVDYALRIPAKFKLRGGVEKWILRRAMDDALPKSVLDRTKAKFWEGAGVGEQLAQHAEEHVSDGDFERERMLPNGWVLNTKEELLYYRIFRQFFGDLTDLSWMGRTKGAPVH
jgi:asparagine synthase (glutamine-hydrolysing)